MQKLWNDVCDCQLMMLMDKVLHPYLGKFVVVFLDDIRIFSKSKKEHLQHLRLVFELLITKIELFGKESKCDFFVKEIHNLDHIISATQMVYEWILTRWLPLLNGLNLKILSSL